ncbi:MAG TPA: hypothetical protein VGC82_10875 [Rhodopila sp.]
METQKLLHEISSPAHAQGATPPVEPMAAPDSAAAVLPPPRRRDPTAPRCGAHIGVMPFRSFGEAPHLALGLADEITNGLSRFRWMFIVSANSLGRFAPENRDEAAIRRELGLDLLLDGSVQQAGSRIRISIRMLDLRASSRIVWARRFDRETDDLLMLQDEIAAEVVAQIDPAVLLIEADRATSRGQADATAYDRVLQSVPLIGRLELEPFLQAGRNLAQAIAQEPDYAAAYAWYAYWHIFLIAQDWTENPKAITQKAMTQKAGELAERSIVLDPLDARGLTISGHVRAFLHRRPREAMVLHDRALSLNPNLAMAWALSAAACAYAGDLTEAERRNNRYKSLSPMDPHAFFFDSFFVLIHLMKRDYATAVELGRNVSLLNPLFSAAYKPYLAALGHLHRDQEAAATRRRLLALEPDFTIERFLEDSAIERECDRMHYAEGLRLAGVRERDPPTANAPIVLRPSLEHHPAKWDHLPDPDKDAR